ncbi:hypothetical protein BESB_052630 [Besnoitia besnoiti]|uniref:TTF-type domain-containing protein n=1 Tax=Besnoitia besnoiti TaxID=94643 RepID=A0A2A9MJP6_BESBE|nr:hypothetical protein BESB_052630 [Besnoitia besnoiti]PFH35612.1 hypothetical protein BESB_052630 [Besnoitia besnoiti]
MSSPACSFLSAFRLPGSASAAGDFSDGSLASTNVEEGMLSPCIPSELCAAPGKQSCVPSAKGSSGICNASAPQGAARPAPVAEGSAAAGNPSGSGAGPTVVRRKQLSGAQKRKRKRELLAKNRVEPASLFSFLSTTVTSQAIYEDWQDLNRAIREESARYEARTVLASASLLPSPAGGSGGCCPCCTRAAAPAAVAGSHDEDGGDRAKRTRVGERGEAPERELQDGKRVCCCRHGDDGEKGRSFHTERGHVPCAAWGSSSGSSTRSCCTSSRESGREDEEDFEEDEGHHHTHPSAAHACTAVTSACPLSPCSRALHPPWSLGDSSGSRRSTSGSTNTCDEASCEVSEPKTEKGDHPGWNRRESTTTANGEVEEGHAASHLLSVVGADLEAEALLPCGKGFRAAGESCLAPHGSPLLASCAATSASSPAHHSSLSRYRSVDSDVPACSAGERGNCSPRHCSCRSSLKEGGGGGGCCSPHSFLLSPVSDDASSVTSMAPTSPQRVSRQLTASLCAVSPHSSPRLVSRCVCAHAAKDEIPLSAQHELASPVSSSPKSVAAPSPSCTEEEDEFADLALWPAQISEELRWRLVKRGPVQLVHYPYPRDNTQRRFGRQHYWRTLPSGEKLWRSWLVYSRTRDAVYCFCCKLFSQLSKSVVTTGFRRWKGIAEVLRSHEQSRDHRSCMLQWKCLCLRLHADVSLGDLKQLCVTTPPVNAVGKLLKGDEEEEGDGESSREPFTVKHGRDEDDLRCRSERRDVDLWRKDEDRKVK